MLTALLITIAGLAPHAQADGRPWWTMAPKFIEISHQQFFEAAKPLVEDFLAAKTKEYGVDIQVEESTWGVRNFVYRHHPFAFDMFYGGRWDWACREVSAVIKGTGKKRVRFSVLASYPAAPVEGSGLIPEYKIVPTCNRLDLRAPAFPELKVDGVASARTFSHDEIFALAAPMLKSFLKKHGKGDDLAADTVSVRLKGVDNDHNPLAKIHHQIFGRNMTCRRVRVYVPPENAVLTAFVSVFYNHNDKVKYLPEDEQSIYPDRRSLRPYRVSLVNGCDNDGIFEAATLRLKPVRPAKPAVAPPPPAEPPAGPAPGPKEDGGSRVSEAKPGDQRG